MTVLMAIAVLTCIAALIITLYLTKAEDPNYGTKRSITNLSFVYLIILPILIVVIVGIWWLF
ncbi:BshB3 potential contributor to bacillithiol synthesis [Alkalihalophilus sp. As8PL]|jgi:hypothetical protein|uniref:BshB3 potential contributor to bacillithiol synthesis n=2 Tax=Alkalihalophilus TaxID=2893060 RepID=A0AB39BU05_9BACI|nr:BshB3 potential contributor to bacillithiol synthesis [Alkalihalophilus lindianensis]MDV2683708.1 BshB3 potential contributor to bacillithiol synthesis [Alkalihalophilus lindianensis]